MKHLRWHQPQCGPNSSGIRVVKHHMALIGQERFL